MNHSFPSKRVTVLEIPDVASFEAQFVYNFFTNDESVNDSWASFKRTTERQLASTVNVDQTKKFSPRYVKFSFTPVTLHQGSVVSNEFVQRYDITQRSNQLTITENFSQIQSESEFSNDDYVGIEFQDDNVDKKLFTLVSGSIAKRVASKNRALSSQASSIENDLLTSLKEEHSLFDAAKALADDASSNVKKNVIVDALTQIDALRVGFIDDDAQARLISDVYAKVKNVSVRGQISNRLIGRIVKNIINDPMSIYSDEFAGSQARVTALQSSARARFNPNVITRAELEPTFKAVMYQPVDTFDSMPETRIVGYIIEKNEILPDGKLKSHPPIIIEGVSVNVAYDENVAYGKSYVYTIRAVAELRTRAVVDDADGVVMGAGLVSSRKSKRIIVKCAEYVPPPPPSDFSIRWDYTNDMPFLTWAFPPNPQRDIKKFQIFKRTNILEPFRLIKQFDFDDSIVKFPSGETPDASVVEIISEPRLTYLDRSFKKTDRAIYAICSIDAHGMSSNYSMQLAVTYDAFKNKIMKDVVSFSGAPKSYPNMLLNTDTFVDTMKVSGFSRLNVYFDPEFLRVNDAMGNDLRLLSKSNVDGGKYRLQIINTDLMQDEIVDIKLFDRRLPNEKDE